MFSPVFVPRRQGTSEGEPFTPPRASCQASTSNFILLWHLHHPTGTYGTRIAYGRLVVPSIFCRNRGPNRSVSQEREVSTRSQAPESEHQSKKNLGTIPFLT